MRDVNLSSLTVESGASYYAAIVTPTDGSACGLVLVRAGLRLLPCYGQDSDPRDGYEGEVCRDSSGRPLAGAHVYYYRLADLENAIVDAVTDRQGRHAVFLEAGTYAYRCILPLDGMHGAPVPSAIDVKHVDVKAARSVRWEEDSGEGSAVAPELAEREVAGVEEVWIGDWHRDDGVGFSWHDVENTAAAVAVVIEKAGADLRQVYFSSPARRELVQGLSNRGLWVNDVAWKDAQWATAYLNFAALADAGLAETIDHDRADYQARHSAFLTNKDRRVESPVGMVRYLADARVLAFTQAARQSSLESGGMMAGTVIGNEAVEEYWDGEIPMTAEESFGSLMRTMGLS